MKLLRVDFWLKGTHVNNAVSLSQLDAIFFDFDGVFTDNHVWVDERGIESVKCSRGDGLALAAFFSSVEFASWRGIVAVISTETNPVVEARCTKMRLKAFLGTSNKLTFVREAFPSLDLKRVAFVGNDVNDLELGSSVGHFICPSDAHPAVLGCADIILSKRGGDSAVRDFLETKLKVS